MTNMDHKQIGNPIFTKVTFKCLIFINRKQVSKPFQSDKLNENGTVFVALGLNRAFTTGMFL